MIHCAVKELDQGGRAPSCSTSYSRCCSRAVRASSRRGPRRMIGVGWLDGSAPGSPLDFGVS